MNAAEVCIRADRRAVEDVIGASTLTVSVAPPESDVTRVELVDGAVANVVDDDQDGFNTSVFVFQPDGSTVARRLFDDLVTRSGWRLELRDEDSGDTLATRPVVLRSV